MPKSPAINFAKKKIPGCFSKLRSRKPFISDPGCDAGGFEVMDLGRVINSNLMGKVGMGRSRVCVSGWSHHHPLWRKAYKGLKGLQKWKDEAGFCLVEIPLHRARPRPGKLKVFLSKSRNLDVTARFHSDSAIRGRFHGAKALYGRAYNLGLIPLLHRWLFFYIKESATRKWECF